MEENNNISFDKLRELAEGKLPKQEQVELLKLLEQDEESRLVYEGLVDFLKNEEGSIDTYLKESENKLIAAKARVEGRSNNIRSIVYWISSAAAVLVLVFFSYNYMLDDLTDYDFKDAGLAVTLSVNQGEFNQAMNAYKQENFEEARSLLMNQLESNPKNDTLNYYLGVVNKANGEFENAIKYFEKVEKNSIFNEKAEYQRAYCHIQEESFDEAKVILNGILDTPNHSMVTKARAFLDYLEE